MGAPPTETPGELTSLPAVSPPRPPLNAPVSYAQAAKGRSQSVPSTTQSSKATSGSITPAKEFNLTPATTSGVPSTMSWADDVTDLEENSNRGPSPKPVEVTKNSVDESMPADQTEQVRQRQSSITVSPVASNSTPTHLTGDDEGSLPNLASEAGWDNKSHVSVPQENQGKSADRQGGREKRKGRSRGKEKEAEEEQQEEEKPVPKPLKEAPIPAVNFWQQRAQEARSKAAAQAGPQKVARHPSGPSSPINVVNAGSGKVGAPNASDEREKEGPSLRKARQDDIGAMPAASDKRDFRKGSQDLEEEQGTSRQRPKPVQTVKDQVSPSEGKSTVKPKGSEVAAKMKPPPAPPSVKDQTSWPTPDSAQEEDKKKAVERGEKVEKDRGTGSASKPHGKNEWVQLPYTPSVIFDTPLPDISPRRGGRGARGGVRGFREGGRGTAHGSMGSAVGTSAEEEMAASRRGRPEGTDTLSRQLSTSKGNPSKTAGDAQQGPLVVGERVADVSDVVRSETSAQLASVPAEKSPVRTYDGSSGQLPQQNPSGPQRGAGSRKQGKGTAPDRRRGSESFGKESDAAYTSQTVSRRTSLAARTNGTVEPQVSSARDAVSQEPISSGPPLWEQDRGEKRRLNHDTHTRSRNFGMQTEDRSHSFEVTGNAPFRGERDRRHERGRGGSRGGRSHGYMNGHAPSSSHYGPQPSSATFPRSPSYPSYSTHNSQYGAHSSQARNWRHSNRSQSTPTDDSLARHTSRFSVPSIPPLQAYMNQFYYETGMYPVSPTPFSPSVDQHSLMSSISAQLDYYFSVDNLCKDVYLRKHMDSQGFVFLDVVQEFNRLKKLTTDPELLKYACLHSRNIELRVGQDGKYRLRKREGWEQWVLDLSERDPSAQNEGPSIVETPPPPYPHGLDLTYLRDSLWSPPSSQETFVASPSDVMGGIPNGYATAPSYYVTSNGNHHVRGRLSAVVADFEPGTQLMPSGYRNTSTDRGAEEDSFPDEAIQSLFVVRKHEVSPQDAPSHLSTSRSFSNGSIDRRTLTTEARKPDEPQSQIETNGVIDVPERSQLQRQTSHDTNLASQVEQPKQESRPSYTSVSPERLQAHNSMRLFWVKDKETPVEYLPPDSTHELYVHLRNNALNQRDNAPEGTCPHEMDVLYQFWSHFLIRNFNALMYDEFRTLAFQDASQRQTRNGVENLLKYYAESLASQNLIRDRTVKDYAELVRAEDPGQGRPAFKQLRSAWRNGALNLKNRKKMGDVIDAQLKAELDT